MRPKWPKLASLARKLAHSSFSSSMHSLLPKDNLIKNIFVIVTFRPALYIIEL